MFVTNVYKRESMGHIQPREGRKQTLQTHKLTPRGAQRRSGTSRTVRTASWAAARRADESRQRRCAGDPQAGSVKPDEVRDEVRRLEDERLRLAPEVMTGNPEALERDKRLEARIRELAGPSREERAAQLREAWLRNHPGGDE